MSNETVEENISKAKLLRELGLSPWELKDFFHKFEEFQQRFGRLESQMDNIHHLMNLRTDSLRNDLDDLKATVDNLDEMIDRNY